MKRRFSPARPRIAALAAACLLSSIACLPARAADINEFQLWTPVYITFPLYRRLFGYAEANPRLGPEVKEIQQLLLRFGVGYQLTPRFSFVSGYMRGYLWNSAPTFVSENRIWQQALYAYPFRRFTVISRSRMEERFFNVTGDQTSVRAREMLRVNVPVPKTNWYLVGYDELFINFNSIAGGPGSGFDQNRLFAGVGRKKFGGRLRTEIGYQHQFINVRNTEDDRAHHALLIQTFVDL